MSKEMTYEERAEKLLAVTVPDNFDNRSLHSDRVAAITQTIRDAVEADRKTYRQICEYACCDNVADVCICNECHESELKDAIEDAR